MRTGSIGSGGSWRRPATTGDEQLAALIEEVASYPVPEPERDPASGIGGSEMLGPVRFHAPGGGELSFFGMFASFDTPFEVTTSELGIELLFPADRTTTEALSTLTNEGPQAQDPRTRRNSP